MTERYLIPRVHSHGSQNAEHSITQNATQGALIYESAERH